MPKRMLENQYNILQRNEVIANDFRRELQPPPREVYISNTFSWSSHNVQEYTLSGEVYVRQWARFRDKVGVIVASMADAQQA